MSPHEKATPLPWTVDLKEHGAPIIRAKTCWLGRSREVAKVLYTYGSEDPEVRENARLIVQAVNSHAALIEALQAVVSALDGRVHSHDALLALAGAREALRLAQGGGA